MSEAARYRTKAAECLAMADRNPHREERESFLEIARLFRQLAAHAERREGNAGPVRRADRRKAH